jgi:hypothetical protein
MKRFFKLGMLAALLAFSCQASVKKSNLRILYVWGSADWDDAYFEDDTARLEANIRERAASFEAMLKEYFNAVTTVRASSYTPELSRSYDVTVMDGTPIPILPGARETDAAGKLIKIVPPAYLPEDFDRPMLTIGELGEKLGRRIGLKTDWYCLCLDADAHHLRREHPIFNAPFTVQLTTRVKATPEPAFHFPYYADGPIPDSIPMWQVQTKGYSTDQQFRVGMVARPWGFEDSPETEYISSGVCLKTLDAVAIGRHGNFLHWGFAASPAYMTPEARTVLANAIVYISRFAGQGVIARKYEDRIATRDYLKELKYYATRTSYEEQLRNDEILYGRVDEAAAKLKERLAKGEKLAQDEMMVFFIQSQRPPVLTFEGYLKKYQRNFFDLFGMDSDAYIKYYDENRDYFHATGSYHLELDEDVKSLGIPNNDPRLLDAAIKLWETGRDAEKARRILARYTLVDFATPGEWRAWYAANKSRLFFTESGGWLFLVNSREPGVNDYHAREVRQQIAALSLGETDDRQPVKATASLIANGNGSKELVVKIKVHPGYHIYGNVATGDPYIPTTLAFELPDGYALAGNLQLPAFKPFTSNGTTIYENEIVFRQPIRGTGTGGAKCMLKYQCCDDHICFPPAEEELLVNL